MVAFRQNGLALDTVTVMSTRSRAQIGFQCHGMILPQSAPSFEVDNCISCQQRQNSGPVAKTFSLRCLVTLKLEQVNDKVLSWFSWILSSIEVVRSRRLLYRVRIRTGPLGHIGQAPSTSGAVSIEISLPKRFNRSLVVQEARFFWYKS